jgi:hypothetical protein
MLRPHLTSLERRKAAELAGGVVLRAIDLMPSATVSHLLLEILEAGIHDPNDRALFGFPPRDPPDGFAAPVSGGPPPAPPGNAPAAGAIPRQH